MVLKNGAAMEKQTENYRNNQKQNSSEYVPMYLSIITLKINGLVKIRNYKTPRGEHRQNTLRHKSQQDPL